MGRIKDYLKVNGSSYWALFDSGAINTYITPEVAKNLTKEKLPEPRKISLGGKRHELTHRAFLNAKIKDKDVSTEALVMDKIGRDETGKEIQILFGALAMEKWNIKLDMRSKRLDMTHYPKEFVEF